MANMVRVENQKSTVVNYVIPYDQESSPGGTDGSRTRMMLEVAIESLEGIVTGTGLCLVSSIVGYSVCFMIEFDTHDVLCLVSSIV